MQIEKPHPWWIAQEGDFACPNCGNMLSDKEECLDGVYTETVHVACPYCTKSITVSRFLEVRYIVEKFK